MRRTVVAEWPAGNNAARWRARGAIHGAIRDDKATGSRVGCIAARSAARGSLGWIDRALESYVEAGDGAYSWPRRLQASE